MKLRRQFCISWVGLLGAIGGTCPPTTGGTVKKKPKRTFQTGAKSHFTSDYADLRRFITDSKLIYEYCRVECAESPERSQQHSRYLLREPGEHGQPEPPKPHATINLSSPVAPPTH